LLPAEQIAPEKRDDWQEVHNYIEAVNTAIGKLAEVPLSNRLLKQTHAILLQGVRGEHKLPGEFRSSQNWIGGSSLADASFIPPHYENVVSLMSDLEQFWHNEQIQVPHLIRIALSHYQFETIHPFLDGNGRIGRLLIPLYLVSHGLLNKPSLYLSDFFERNRASYYDALMQVRTSNNIVHWLRFFLNGVMETATRGRDLFRQILTLRAEVEHQALDLGKRAPLAREALNVLYRQPVVNAKQLEMALQISTPTVNSLIKALIDKEILVEMTGQQRWRSYVFDPYLKLFLS
jgi:Fic family protein